MIDITILYIYQRNVEDVERIQRAVKALKVEKYVIYTDSDRERVAYLRMKQDLQQQIGLVLFHSIDALGADKDEIIRELSWYIENQIQVLFLSYPSFFKTQGSAWNCHNLTLLKEMLEDPCMNVIPFPERRKPYAGRKKIQYPENWEQYYDLWERKEITGQEFMKAVHLKRGTFYHMIRDYREERESVKKEYHVLKHER